MIEEPIALAVDWSLANLPTVIHIGMTVAVSCFMAAVMIWIPYVWHSQQEESFTAFILICTIIAAVMLIREMRSYPYPKRAQGGLPGLTLQESARVAMDDEARKQRGLERFKDDMEGGG